MRSYHLCVYVIREIAKWIVAVRLERLVQIAL